MADYNSPTIVVPTIPTTDMTDLEQLLLTHVFDFEEDGDGLYFFDRQCMNDMPDVDIDAIREALAEEPGADCRSADFVRDQLAGLKEDDAFLQLDTEIPWETVLQDIVRRSPTIEHIDVITTFTCSRMRKDGWGAAVTVITADQVLSSSTDEMVNELFDRARYGELGCAPGHGCHVLLRLLETHIRKTVEVIFETEAPDGLAPADVTDEDIREAVLAITANSDLSHEEGLTAFNAALAAIRIAASRDQAAR